MDSEAYPEDVVKTSQINRKGNNDIKKEAPEKKVSEKQNEEVIEKIARQVNDFSSKKRTCFEYIRKLQLYYMKNY